MTLNSRRLTTLNFVLTIVMTVAILFALWQGFQARQIQAELEAERRQYVENLQAFAENQRLLEEKLIALETQLQRLTQAPDED